MTHVTGTTRGRFVKQSAAAAVAFLVAGRELISAKAALAAQCVFITCVPIAYTCSKGTLYLVMRCDDAFSGWPCYTYWEVVGCCKG